MQSTIAISTETKQLLAKVKVHPRESYEDAIKRLLEYERREKVAQEGSSAS
jgi:predicted CopG family antitoxin